MSHFGLLGMGRAQKTTAGTAMAASLVIAGCGGGGSSSDNTGAGTTTFTGTVEAPNGQVANFQDPSLMDRLLAAIQLREAVAQSAGSVLSPVANARVQLVEVNDDGTIGEVLGETSTDSSGEYTGRVDGVEAAADLMCVVPGSSGTDLRAPATQDTVDIDPPSTAASNGFLSAVQGGTALSEFSPAELNGITERVREQVEAAINDGNFTYDGNKTLQENLTTIENTSTGGGSTIGDDLTDQVTVAGTKTTIPVKDRYYLVEMGMEVEVNGSEAIYSINGSRLDAPTSTTSDGDSSFTISDITNEVGASLTWTDNNGSLNTAFATETETTTDDKVGPFAVANDGRVFFQDGTEAIISADGNRFGLTSTDSGSGYQSLVVGMAA